MPPNIPEPLNKILKSFTSSDLEAIKGSWMFLYKSELRLENGQKVYLTLFRIYPETQAFFRGYGSKTPAELKKIPKFNVVSKQLMNSIDSLIQLFKKPDILVARTTELTEKHKVFNVCSPEFEKLEKVYDTYLKEALGDSYKEETGRAWTKFFNFITEVARFNESQGPSSRI